MFCCENCFRRFHRPLTVREDYGLPGGRYQEFWGCPYCKATGTVVHEHDHG